MLATMAKISSHCVCTFSCAQKPVRRVQLPLLHDEPRNEALRESSRYYAFSYTAFPTLRHDTRAAAPTRGAPPRRIQISNLLSNFSHHVLSLLRAFLARKNPYGAYNCRFCMTNQEMRHYARVHGTTRLVTPRSLRYDTIRAPRRRLVARLRDEFKSQICSQTSLITSSHY